MKSFKKAVKDGVLFGNWSEHGRNGRDAVCQIKVYTADAENLDETFVKPIVEILEATPVSPTLGRVRKETLDKIEKVFLSNGFN